MNAKKLIGKKVKVTTLAKSFFAVWKFDESRKYKIKNDDVNSLFIKDNYGLALSLCVEDDKVYAPGVEHIYKIEVM